MAGSSTGSNSSAEQTWSSGRLLISGEISTPTEVSIAYLEEKPAGNIKGVVLLLHGFPETSYQWRGVIGPLAAKGYHVIVPDYRGAGLSSKPRDIQGYRKAQMAEDLVGLLDKLEIQEKVHVVGHDIGGMIAHSFAARFSDRTRSVMWGECPLPGTSIYEETKKTAAMFHFSFHAQSDLPEALVQGKERIYLTHFYNRLAFNAAVWTPEVIDHYVHAYSQAGAMRCGMDSYRMFEMDARDNKDWVKSKGMCKVPACTLSGSESLLSKWVKRQFDELYDSFEMLEVEKSGHWVAEENPRGCVEKIVAFISKH